MIAGRGQVSIGAELGVAVGPVGRTGAGNFSVAAEGVAHAYSCEKIQIQPFNMSNYLACPRVMFGCLVQLHSTIEKGGGGCKYLAVGLAMQCLASAWTCSVRADRYKVAGKSILTVTNR